MKFHLLLLILVQTNISCFTNSQKVKEYIFPFEDLCDYVGTRLIQEFKIKDKDVTVILKKVETSKSDYLLNFNNCLKESLVTNYKVEIKDSDNWPSNSKTYCLTIQKIFKETDSISFDYILGNQSESITYNLIYNTKKKEVTSDEFKAIIVN